MAGAIHVRCDLRADTSTPNDQQLQRRMIIGTRVGAPLGATGRGLLGFWRVGFPFTFIGGMALAIGAWGVGYVGAHRALGPGLRGPAVGTAFGGFGVGGDGR